MKLNTYLALFRGINVGGKNILPMKDLLELVTQLGVQKARTYIQSGNLVFDAKPADCATIEQQIRLAIKARFGFEPAIILIGAKQLAQIIEASPFSSTEEQAQSAHFGFLSKPATQAVHEARSVQPKGASSRLEHSTLRMGKKIIRLWGTVQERLRPTPPPERKKNGELDWPTWQYWPVGSG